MNVVELSDPGSWPPPIARELGRAARILSSYERERAVIDMGMSVNVMAQIDPPVNPHAAARDALIADFDGTLQQFSVRAWHCTRLLPHERTWIEEHGLARHSRALFVRRLDAAVTSGVLTKAGADRLLRRSQVEEHGRDGLLHLIVDRAVLRDEAEVGALLRNWGGEALCSDGGHGSELGGSPFVRASSAAIIKAELPIRLLAGLPRSIGEQMVNRYAHDHGLQTEHGCGTNAKLIEDLSSDFVSSVILRDDPRFSDLTGFGHWRTSI